MLEEMGCFKQYPRALKTKNDERFRPRVEKRKADGYTYYLRFRYDQGVQRDFASA